MANYMAEVAKMLGVELGEEFEVEQSLSMKHRITINGFERYEDGNWLGNRALDSSIFEKLLTGKYTLRCKPWKPKEGKCYYFIEPDGSIGIEEWCVDNSVDMNYYKLGNCYRTRKEAEANRDKWVEFYASDEVLEV